MTTTATEFVKPERIYEPLQFELHDAPEDVKGYSLLAALCTGELITNDTLMDAITMGFNMLPRLAPTPGDRVRITELLTDEVRHCYMNDHLARALGGDPAALDYFSASGLATGVTAAAPPFLLAQIADHVETDSDESEEQDASSAPLVHTGEGLAALPQLITKGMGGAMTGGDSGSYLWTLFAVFNTCIDRAAGILIHDTINSSFAPLARMNRGISVDEAGHAQAGFHHLRDVCATTEGRDEAQAALDAIWPVSIALFETLPPEGVAESVRLGLLEHTHAELKAKYIDAAVPLLDGLGLCVPSAA
jgi:hypothetical protein